MVKHTFKHERTLRALKPAQPGQRYTAWDSTVPSFGVRITAKGTKTFGFVKRIGSSPHPVWRAIGLYGAITLEDARDTARQQLALVKKGIDPKHELERERLAELRRQADTFAAVAEKLCATKLKAQRRGFVVERIIRRELLPSWGKRPIAEILRRDVRELIDSVIARGADTYAHNVFDAVQAVFNYAVANELIEFNPCKELKRRELIGARRHRERTLTDHELLAFWRATGRLGYQWGTLYRLLLLTGARLDEAASAQWREFDLHKRVWTIPAERFKSGSEHTIPLSDDACALLETLPRFRKGDFLFSATFGETPVTTFSKGKVKLDRHMLRTLQALARQRGHEDPHSIKLDAFVVHDVRRTVRTRLSALKVQDHVAEMVIGHGRKGLQRVYDQHRFLDERREALDTWANYLRSIVAPPPANVVSLAKARA